LFLIIISGLFAVTSVSVCTPWFHNTVTSSCSHTSLGVFFYYYYYYPNFSLLSFSWEIFTYPGMYHQQD
jgi:hypothetical protein